MMQIEHQLQFNSDNYAQFFYSCFFQQNILDRSEESQLEAAIAASIKESSVNHNARRTNDGTVILDSDSDVIFSKSDDGDNESDSYEEDICVEDGKLIKNLIYLPQLSDSDIKFISITATICNLSTKNEKYNPEAMATSPALRECNKIDLTTDDRIDEASTSKPIYLYR